MKILIETIPHSSQRYPTVGDWQFHEDPRDSRTLTIKVSQMSDWRYEALVGLHEAVEAILCQSQGVDELAVDRFDRLFKPTARRFAEPGDDPRAPYHYQHRIATAIEVLLAAELRVDWDAYASEIERL